MSFKLKGLREQRGAIKAQIEAIGTKLQTERRAMNADEKALFDKLKGDFAAVSDSIRTLEATMIEMEAAAEAPGEGADGDADGSGDRSAGRKPRLRSLAFSAWARSQHGVPLTREHKAACERTNLNPRVKEFRLRIGGAGSLLKRAQSTNGSAGGYTIAQGFSGVLEKALKDYSGVRGACGQITTDTGATLPYPTEDDTGNTGARLDEGAEALFADDNFGVVNFGAFKYTSKGVLISNELLQDSEFDLAAHIEEQIGIRIGRAQGPDFTTGTGTGQPQGIVTAATLGITAASGTAFTADELTRLAFSIDPAYRNDPSFGYMMHDTAVAYALLLKDGQGRPLLRDSYRDGITIPLLNGFPVHTNQFMDPCSGVGGVPVTAKKHVLCGAFEKFKVRDVGTVRVRRLDERYAEKDQVGFLGFARADSRCVNSAAIKYLQQA